MSTEKPQKLLPLDEDWNRAVAVAAHPDDLEYGAASAIARWTEQGKEITYLLLTRGEAGIDGMHPREAGPLREAEEVAGALQVGVTTVEFWTTRTALSSTVWTSAGTSHGRFVSTSRTL